MRPLDMHLLLRAAAMPERLSPAALALLEDEGNELWFSAASIWEVAIKSGLGREDFSAEPSLLRRGLLDHGYCELAVNGEHAVVLRSLPPLHRDPFDRMLVAQAISEGILLVTADAAVAGYPAAVRSV